MDLPVEEETAIEEENSEALSAKLFSDYLGRLFSEGQFFDVVSFADHALDQNPLNYDLMVYRSCAYIVLQVSGSMPVSDSQVQQAVDQLQMISSMISVENDYNQSLDFYIALGYLVLRQVDKADKLIDALPDYDDIPEAIDYYTQCRDNWIIKNNYIPILRPQEPLPS